MYLEKCHNQMYLEKYHNQPMKLEKCHNQKLDKCHNQKKKNYASRESTIEEKFIEHIETDRSSKKKSSNGKLVGIIIGVIASNNYWSVEQLTLEVVQIYFQQIHKLKKESHAIIV